METPIRPLAGEVAGSAYLLYPFVTVRLYHHLQGRGLVRDHHRQPKRTKISVTTGGEMIRAEGHHLHLGEIGRSRHIGVWQIPGVGAMIEGSKGYLLPAGHDLSQNTCTYVGLVTIFGLPNS